MGTKRSKALHNFTMPCGLRWGNQRLLRCMNVNSSGQISLPNGVAAANSGGSSDHRGYNRIQQRRTVGDGEKDRGDGLCGGSSKVSPTQAAKCEDGRWISHGDGGVGIGSTREKVMFDLHTAADKMKDAIFKDELEDGKASVSVSVSVSPPQLPPQLPIHVADSREGNTCCPWNLRTRRASSTASVSGIVSDRNDTAPSAGDGKGFKTDAHSGAPQMRVPTAATAQKSPIHRSNGAGTAASVDDSERPKFSVTLSKREIDEDFFSMVGRRPPRRPKKRGRVVQRQMDTLFPGLWLTEVTPDMYKVPETAPRP